MAGNPIYNVVLDRKPSGLVVVKNSDFPELLLSGRSLEHVLATLPAVLEHLFLDQAGQHYRIGSSNEDDAASSVPVDMTILVKNQDLQTVKTFNARLHDGSLDRQAFKSA